MVRLRFDFTQPTHRKRFALAAVALLALIVIVLVTEWLLTSSLQRNWNSVKQDEEQALIRYVQISFAEFQKEVVEIIQKVSRDSGIVTALAHGSGSSQQLFERLQELEPDENTIEIFSSSKNQLGWNGKEGLPTDTAWLKPVLRSFVVHEPIYSFLIVAAPIQSGSSTIGYIVAKRLFDVEYPISNRFINESVFSASFTSRYGINADFDFSLTGYLQYDDDILGAPLNDINGSRLGVALLHPLTMEERVLNLHARFQEIMSVLSILFLLLVVLGVISLQRVYHYNGRKTLAIIIAMWGVRYALLVTGFPSSVAHLDIFDPALFASSFGFGIAKSIGDIFITAITLLATILVFSTALLRSGKAAEKESKKASNTWAVISLIAASFALPIVLRGYASVIHSAVYDSTISYFDPMYVLPPFHLGVMLLALFMITLALVTLSVVTFVLLYRTLTHTVFPAYRTNRVMLIVVAVFIGGSFLVGLLHPNPLFNQVERIGYIAGFGLSAFITGNTIITTGRLFSIRTITVFLAAGIISLIYPLEKKVHEFDRSHVEFLASNIFLSADSYLTMFTQQALRELATSEFTERLNDPDLVNTKKIAFRTWAQSSLSREGYNCSVTYYDRNGVPVSSFTIGTRWNASTSTRDSVFSPKNVIAEDRSIESHIIRFYRGYSPVFDTSDALIGGVNLEVTAEKQALVGGETPEFLRNYPTGDPEGRHRTLTYSEYSKGELVYSSSPVFHHGIILPDSLFAHIPSEGLWIEQRIGTITYETFLFPADSASKHLSWHALSMRGLDPLWHVYHVLRIAFFLLLCSLAGGICSYPVLVLRRNFIGFSFRTKLIGAFFIVALIPTGILAFYNRQYAADRHEHTLADQLNRETETIASSLENQWRISAPFDLASFTDQEALQAASDFNIQFILFDRFSERASSKPELFRAELFDRRMMSDVYLNVVLRQNNFYSHVQSIGTLQYIVGYRPLVTEAGTVFAVVAVPTLFRLREIDRELVRQNAYLFAAFVFAMIVALLAALIFSHQISSPIRRLYQATRRIGAGDFNVTLGTNRADELGELERSFRTMLNDLKRSQEATMKAQRELAWKEMAKQVAHEIKNPLTPMKLSIQHLRHAYSDKMPDFEKLLHQVTNTVLEQIDTLSRIASEFSHFARMPEQKFEQCDLHLILREVTNLFNQYTKVIFNLQFCSISAIITADKEEIRRAFINIVRNSIQAMNEQGNITIRTDIIDSTVKITIHDTGAGITPEIRDHLFEPNFSTKTDGMGLGLAIVKKTIDNLGGTITVESGTGLGTSVTIFLPLVRTN